MKILIAEDDIANQQVAMIMMEMWGFGFDIASNGQEAVEKARKNEGTYDICLMDINMPTMNGYEATHLIRRKMRYLPILALTANLTAKDRYFVDGLDDYLEKPYHPDQLYNKIQELTIKTETLFLRGNNFHIKRELPMDQNHARELRELKKQNLIKVKFDDISGAEVVIHKNIINKIVQDFNINKQFVSTFLNRNPDKPTKCILFGNNCRMPQVYLDDDDFDKELRIENEEMEKYPEMILKIEKK